MNKVYNYSLTKTKILKWKYAGEDKEKIDKVRVIFSMKNVLRSDTTSLYEITYRTFGWRDLINYNRDSLHSTPICLVMDERGLVQNARNSNLLYDDIANDSATKPYVAGILKDYVSEKALTDIFNKIFAVLPVKKVKEQDRWVTDISTTNNAPIHFSNVFLLDKSNDDTAIIKIESIISARQSPGDEYYLNGSQHGQSILHAPTGMPFIYDVHLEKIVKTTGGDIKETEHTILELL